MGSRGSKLALIQAESVAARIREANPDIEVSIRQIIESGKVEVSPQIRTAMAAVMERDDMGPKVGEPAPDFHLKRLESEERIRLSSFRGKQPVAMVFGSYT